MVGLLVDRTGFPPEIGCFEGNKAETHTIVPMIRQNRHDIAGVEMVIAADAGMLSAGNLTALDEAGLEFVVGSRVTKAPADLVNHFHWNGDAFADGQIIDRARSLIGLKGYLTNLPAQVMGPGEVIAKYHDLWQVEQSLAHAENRPEDAADVPSHPRRHRSPPHRRVHRTRRRPLPADRDRDLDPFPGPDPASAARDHHDHRRPSSYRRRPLTPDAVRIPTSLDVPTR